MVQNRAVDSAEGKNGGLRGRRPHGSRRPLEHGRRKHIKVLDADMFISPHPLVSNMDPTTAYEFLATADNGTIAHIACVAGFVVMPFIEGVWECVKKVIRMWP